VSVGEESLFSAGRTDCAALPARLLAIDPALVVDDSTSSRVLAETQILASYNYFEASYGAQLVSKDALHDFNSLDCSAGMQ
jgi:hypothetical protein